MNFESSPLWALLRRQGLGSTGAVANPDLKVVVGGFRALQTQECFYTTVGFVGTGSNLMNSAEQNLLQCLRVL